jgi:polysaccharide pyruvyl transferase WcaK-like protein
VEQPPQPGQTPPVRPLDVGIVNAFGGNRGDEAMLRALVNWLQAAYPGIRLTLYANSPVDLSADRLQVRPWPTLHVPLRKTSYRLHALAQRWLLERPARLRRADSGLGDHDFVLSAPAGPYFGDLNRRSNFATLLPLAIAAAKGIPFGIVATSAGPFRDATWNRLRRQILNRARFWTVREPHSAAHLRKLKLEIDCRTGADLVFAAPVPAPELHRPHDANFQRELEHFQQLSKSGPLIIATLNKTNYLSPDGTRHLLDFDEYVSRMERLLAHALARTQGHIVLFPHFYGEDRTEQNILSAVCGRLAGCANRLSILHPYLDCDAQRSLYRLADFVISHRYHPTIFALAAECPCLCIRHQFKVDGMLQMLGDPGPVVRTDDALESWLTAFDDAWTRRDEIRNQIRTRLPQVVQAAQVHSAVLKTHLDSVLVSRG